MPKSNVTHIYRREPADDVLHKPHEKSDGLRLPADKRIEHLRAALEAIQTEAVDLEHARILAYSALRLDAGGAKGPKRHLRRFIDEKGTDSERLRRFLALVPNPAPTAISEVVRRHVHDLEYEGVAGSALGELPEALRGADKTPSKGLVQKYARKSKQGSGLDTTVLADACDALIDELRLDRSRWSAGDWAEYVESEATLAHADENLPWVLRMAAIGVRDGEYGVPAKHRAEVIEYLALLAKKTV